MLYKGETMEEYLRSTEVIDYDNPDVLAKAKELAKGVDDILLIAKRCFEWVRDQIQHSMDYERNTVTCNASDVLKEGTGFCYAKSHLLAALLRANSIPTGFCYQRLSENDDGPPFFLHGLNAIYLHETGWYRIDPRGNKEGVNAQFCPPVEKLAFKSHFDGEADFPEVWPDPLPQIINALHSYHTLDEFCENIPDIEIIPAQNLTTPHYKIDFQSIQWETPAAGVRFKAYEQGGKKLRLVEFSKKFVEPDWCTNGHIGFVLEGQIEINFDGKKEVFGPGDGIFIPVGKKHKHKATVLTDTAKVVLAEDV